MALKPKFDDVKLLNTILADSGDAKVTGGKAVITGLTDNIPLENVDSFTRTAYSAGVASVKIYDWSTVTVVDGVKHLLKIKHNGVEKEYSAYVANGSTTTQIATQLETNINNDVNAIVTVSRTTDVLTITLKAAQIVNGDFTATVESGVTVTDDGTGASTLFVAASGTPAVVDDFDAANVSQAAQYTTYKVVWFKEFASNAVGGRRLRKEQIVYIFADSLATNYADFDATIQTIFSNPQLDIVKRYGTIAFSKTTITGATTLKGHHAFVEATSGGAFTVTLPDSATSGTAAILIVNNSGGTMTIAGAGTDTIDGVASVTIVDTKAAFILNDGAGKYIKAAFV